MCQSAHTSTAGKDYTGLLEASKTHFYWPRSGLIGVHTGKLVEAFAYRGVAAWRVAPRVAPARSAPLEKMVNFSSRYARILSKIGALRAILVKSARYARSNLASGALRASQHSLTEVGVKWFFFPHGSGHGYGPIFLAES